jgi:3-dehydroquinate synthase
MTSKRTIKVDLSKACPDRSYLIVVERGILDSVGERVKEACPQAQRCVVITNPTVGALYLERLVDSLKASGITAVTIEVPDGEKYKNLTEISSVYDRLLTKRLERSSPVVALGGGVIGDMAGFVAATYLRGVPFIQIPTTLLAQVDSSVGGKTGVNHALGKNLIGAFYQPRGVFIDPQLLSTLEGRELKAGLAEVVKYGVIRDEPFLSFLEANVDALLALDSDAVAYVIERSCNIKAEVVANDELEAGLRAILNFGHTFGHAIEAITNYKEFRHGEGVAIGMVMAADLAAALGMADETLARRIEKLLIAFGLPVRMPETISMDVLISALSLDKKVKDGAIRFILPEQAGKVVLKEVSEVELRANIKTLQVDI